MPKKRIALSVGVESSKQLTKIARKISLESGVGTTAQDVLTMAAFHGLRRLSDEILHAPAKSEKLAD